MNIIAFLGSIGIDSSGGVVLFFRVIYQVTGNGPRLLNVPATVQFADSSQQNQATALAAIKDAVAADSGQAVPSNAKIKVLGI